jgi:hypothetical protein
LYAAGSPVTAGDPLLETLTRSLVITFDSR